MYINLEITVTWIERVIKRLAGILGSLNSENKVDFTNPQNTMVVEIVNAVCCLCVVKDYTLFRKYNLQDMVRALRTWHSSPQSGQHKQEMRKVLNWNLVTDQIKTQQKEKMTSRWYQRVVRSWGRQTSI